MREQKGPLFACVGVPENQETGLAKPGWEGGGQESFYL